MGKPGPKPTISDLDILREFALSADPAFTASELTDSLDMSRQGVDNRLRELSEEGLLRTKMAGRARIYWLSYEGRKMIESNRDG
jgi:predicted transcriptional regulator